MKRINLGIGRRGPPLGVLVGVVVAVLGVATGTALATGAFSSIVGPDGTIHGCYKAENGQLRVVAAGEECGPSELALQWNQTGPRGETGAVGATGAQGATGATGAQGPKGDQGETGGIGPTGAQGPAGDPGAKGEPGAKGDPGAKGETGVKGDPCLSSDPACIGPKGDPGATGATGPQGPIGPAGASGSGVDTGAVVTPAITDTGANTLVKVPLFSIDGGVEFFAACFEQKGGPFGDPDAGSRWMVAAQNNSTIGLAAELWSNDDPLNVLKTGVDFDRPPFTPFGVYGSVPAASAVTTAFRQGGHVETWRINRTGSKPVNLTFIVAGWAPTTGIKPPCHFSWTVLR